MVFQKPTPFPTSIYENVAFALSLSRAAVASRELDDGVEDALRQAALWDEVKDKLNDSGTALSGGQQQRLCIARAIAVRSRGHPDGRADARRSTRSRPPRSRS